jgi:hypothetical protein
MGNISISSVSAAPISSASFSTFASKSVFATTASVSRIIS